MQNNRYIMKRVKHNIITLLSQLLRLFNRLFNDCKNLWMNSIMKRSYWRHDMNKQDSLIYRITYLLLIIAFHSQQNDV